MTEPAYLPYRQASKEFAEHPVGNAEVPVGYSVSVPLPTLRWPRPAYTCFAGPAVRRPGQPLRLGAPDRWWALDAHHGRLLFYAMVAVHPFAADIPEGPVTVPPMDRSLAAVQEDHRFLEELMEEAAPVFFTGGGGDAALRRDLGEVLDLVLPTGTMPWYRALTPDFFDWLEQ